MTKKYWTKFSGEASSQIRNQKRRYYTPYRHEEINTWLRDKVGTLNRI